MVQDMVRAAVSTITAENVAGLVVGEGCFYAESAADPKYTLGWRLRPAFCIEMRADDRGVLEAVRAHLRCGQIYALDFGRYRGYELKDWSPHAKYRVSSTRDLHDHVLPFFQAHPLFGRKAVAFEIFSALVTHLVEQRHRTPAGLAEGKRLAERLSAHNSRGLGA
jgi:LAGLIDADG endonuclease